MMRIVALAAVAGFSEISIPKKYAASGGWGIRRLYERANLAMRRCTQSASPATSRQKIATTFSLTTHLRPELKMCRSVAESISWTAQTW
jgi:hypothetical protein